MEDENAALVPIEQKTVEFYEDRIVAVEVDVGGRRRVYVPIRPIVTYLGLDWPSQYQRIQRDAILSEAIAGVVVMTTPDPVRGGGGPQETTCLPIEMLHGYLFGIQAGRVRPEIRDKVLRYQRECYLVLYEAFRERPLELTDTTEALMQAMRENARQQMELWDVMLEERRRNRITEEVVQQHDDQLLEHELRLSQLQYEQAQLRTRLANMTRLLPSPDDPLNPAQKSEIQRLVSELVAAADKKGVRLGGGSNNFPAVWTALKRRYNVAKYDELTGNQFPHVVRWLEEWQSRVVGE